MKCKYYMVKMASNIHEGHTALFLYKVYDGVAAEDIADIIIDDCEDIYTEWSSEESDIWTQEAEDYHSDNRYSIVTTEISEETYEKYIDCCDYYSEVGRC